MANDEHRETAMTDPTPGMDRSLAKMDDEQFSIPRHRLHGDGHFFGHYAAEHAIDTEFVIGAAFVAPGASIGDILMLIQTSIAQGSQRWPFFRISYAPS